ncbi:hypothetical protein Tco_0959418 [Tanacetum coccineum]
MKDKIRAKVNGKTIVISESSVRRDLQFNDEDDIACLTNIEIFENLQLMRYENLSDRLTFYKSYFSPQWKNLDPNSKKFLMYPRFLQLFLNNKIENLTPTFNDEYDTPSHTKKEDVGEGSGQPTDPQHTPTTASPSHVEPILTSSGPTTLVADETIYKEREDTIERAATTASSLEAEHDSGNIFRTQSMATLNEPLPHGTGSGSGPRRQDTILGGRPAQTRVLDVENVKDAQALEIKQLKKRVKKLEKKKKSRTPQLKRRLFKVRIESSTEKSFGDQEDASKQERNEIDQDEGISWFQVDAETQGSAPITTAGVSVSTAEPSTAEPSTPPPTTITVIEDDDLTIAQTLMKMKSVKLKEKSKERG